MWLILGDTWRKSDLKSSWWRKTKVFVAWEDAADPGPSSSAGGAAAVDDQQVSEHMREMITLFLTRVVTSHRCF